MKNIYLIAILSLLGFTTSFAQSSSVPDQQIDGNKLIKQLLNERYTFNKGIIKHISNCEDTPQAQSILTRLNGNVFLNGHSYIIRDSRVVEIKGVAISKRALTLISDRLIALDRYQKACAENVNNAYQKGNRDMQYIKTTDRQFFATLNQMLSITENISKQIKKPNPSVTIELAMQKVNVPLLLNDWNGNSESLSAK